MNTPLKADARIIRDRDGKWLAECKDAATAQQIVLMVNATAMGG